MHICESPRNPVSTQGSQQQPHSSPSLSSQQLQQSRGEEKKKIQKRRRAAFSVLKKCQKRGNSKKHAHSSTAGSSTWLSSKPSFITLQLLSRAREGRVKTSIILGLLVCGPIEVMNLCLVVLCLGLNLVSAKTRHPPNAERIRAHIQELNQRSRYVDMVKTLDELETKYGTLVFDNYLPSLYTFKGVALHSMRDTEGAEKAFEKGAEQFPNDSRAWINLGETRTHLFKTNLAIEAFSRASALGDQAATSRLLKAKGWVDSYQDFERISSAVEKQATNCILHEENCLHEGPSGTEYTSIKGFVHREISRQCPNAASSPFVVEDIAPLWNVKEELENERRQNRGLVSQKKEMSVSVRRRLKVGVISSDYGVHPVSSLIRGVLEFINQDKIELFCFSVTNKMSWWGHNITGAVEHFITLSNMNYEEAAVVIAETGVEILIDLNGHTLNTGLGIMKHRPAPIQVSFLGLPTTTGADFIDYYIGDPVALPAELFTHFTEKLMLMPPCYIATDYAQLLGGILSLKGEKRWSRSALKADSDLSHVSLLFGTFSNSQKLDPNIMHVWMNILGSYPDSKMFMVQHLGTDLAIPHLRNITQAFGVRSDRLTFSRHLPWIHHIQAKTSVDLLLDSTSKNGHTTGLDAVWAGIPMVTLAGGRNMPARAGESIHAALESDTGLVYSLKEYEDIALKFARDHRRLKIWRGNVERLRTTSTLFDTQRWTATFTRLLESTWEASHVGVRTFPANEDEVQEVYNVFHIPNAVPARELDVSHVVEPTTEELAYLSDRQVRLEAAGGAGRSNRIQTNPVFMDGENEKLPRGGTGTGGPGAPTPENPYGAASQDDYFDPLAHRTVLCSVAEKVEFKEGATSTFSCPEQPSVNIIESANTCEAGGSAGVNYSDYPIPSKLFLKSPLILNVGGIIRSEYMVNVNAQPSSYKIEKGEVDIIRLMEKLEVYLFMKLIVRTHTLEIA